MAGVLHTGALQVWQVCFEQKTKAIYGPVRTKTGVHLIFLHSRIEK